MASDKTSAEYSNSQIDPFELELMQAFNVPASTFASVSHSENVLQKTVKRLDDAGFESAEGARSFNLFNAHITTGLFTPKVHINTEVLNSVISENQPKGACWRLTITDCGEGVAEAVATKQQEPVAFKRKIKQMEDDYFSEIDPEDEDTKLKKRKSISIEDMDEDQLKRSVARSKKLMRHKSLMLKVDRMFTFTYKQNQTDRDLCAKHLAATIRKYKKVIGKEFHYVAVFEVQKRGAIHIHLSTNAYHDVNELRRCWQHVTKDKGNVNVQKYKNKIVWERASIISYMSKYMSKDMAFNQLAKKRYLSSRGIPKPKKFTYFVNITMNDTDDEFTKAVLYLLVKKHTHAIVRNYYQVPTEYGKVYFTKTY